MTRKDYVSIAAAFDCVRQDLHCQEDARSRIAVTSCAVAVANVMARDNSRFDRARFLKACGVEG